MPRTRSSEQHVVEGWVQVNVMLPSACTHHKIHIDEFIPFAVAERIFERINSAP